MSVFLPLVLWLLLFVACWPLAVVALVLWPLFWLLALPFRFVGIVLSAILAVLQAILMLPVTVLRWHSERSSYSKL